MTHTPSAPTRKAPGILLAVLMAAMAAGPVFNYGVGALSATIVESYGITEGQYGFIITAVFVMAGLAAPLLGVLADRIDTRVQLTLIFGGVLVAFLLSATWQSYAVLLVAALIAGLAQSFSNPVTNRIVAQRVPLTQRSAWMGWKQSGVQVGLLVAGLTFPVVGAALGWRGAALFGALLCVPLLVTGWSVVTRLQRRARESTPTTTPPAPTVAGPGRESRERTVGIPGPRAVGAGVMAGSAAASSGALPPAVWLLTLTSFLNAVGTQGVNVYASLFAVRAMGYTVTVAGLLLGVMGVIGIGSRIGWGRVTGRLGRPAPLIQVMSLGGIVGLGLLVLAESTQQHWLMWLGVAFHAALPLAANVVINSGIVAAVPKERIGVASGLVATGMYLGFALGPVVVGQLVDLTGAFTAGWTAVAGAYVLCFVAAVVLGRVQRRVAA
ncbi:MFS transporter [Kocuria rhizophila]|uniref:MFS transporter n=1 Tax=Kocuria rhizophila TaxID=72000 RepID=UPI000C7C1DB4|nr:MFS transporter [Kocuria rhizophila]MBO4145480.1 MFS transporter [Kocuria rhizophila]MDN3225189.1 MFS transporter [Kocuria rhizophila]PKZ38159.1 MFS transporter [Kocuria rhizophila]QTK31700.1 MFS transporter [Kocuria rhizophila]